MQMTATTISMMQRAAREGAEHSGRGILIVIAPHFEIPMQLIYLDQHHWETERPEELAESEELTLMLANYDLAAEYLALIVEMDESGNDEAEVEPFIFPYGDPQLAA